MPALTACDDMSVDDSDDTQAKSLEEKLMAEEGLKKTENDLIHIGCPIPFDTDEFLKELDSLMTAAYSNKKDIRDRVAKIVSTYRVEKR